MKKAFFIVSLMLALGLGGLFFIFWNTAPLKPDMLVLNDAMMAAIHNNDPAETPHLMREALAREADNMATAQGNRDRLLLLFLCLYIGIFTIAVGGVFLYLHRTILRPFQKLESFASRVAQGDLSFPLEMDIKNRFGAFSESFDLMREQLDAARENESRANISKKELVASLSHDIKTPVSSIKIIAELCQARQLASVRQRPPTPQSLMAAGNEENSVAEALSAIVRKADQIDLLITNMFTATLEELKQLKVSPAEITTAELAEHIRASDYQKKVRPFALPECVVTADSLRFRQVIDNVIGNSYKYAGTDIEVSGGFDRDFLTLTVQDSGPGVSPDELSLLCEKFYRAGNAEGKSGSGLGLYLSQYFLTQMGGSLMLESCDGLRVIMRLKI